MSITSLQSRINPTRTYFILQRIPFEDIWNLLLSMQKKDGINKKSKNTKVVVRTFGWNLLIIFLLINSVILNKSHILCFCFTYMLYTGAGCHNIHLTHTEYLSPPVFRLYVLTSDHLLQESNWEKHKNKRNKKENTNKHKIEHKICVWDSNTLGNLFQYSFFHKHLNQGIYSFFSYVYLLPFIQCFGCCEI